MIKDTIKGLIAHTGFEVRRHYPPPTEPPVPDSARAFMKRMWPVTVDVPMIRVGGDADGAYLMPDDLEGLTALFSPGVEQVAIFETEMAARGMICYMADASVTAPPTHRPEFRFDAKFLGLRETDRTMTIDAWVDAKEPGEHDLLLQMDIEGSEWTVLANMSEALLRRLRIIIVEVHSMGRLLDDYGSPVIANVIDRLLATHHLVHNHPNNLGGEARRHDVVIPEVMELTFLRKDRANVRGYATTFPHSLDITANGPEYPALPLPTAWYSAEVEKAKQA